MVACGFDGSSLERLLRVQVLGIVGGRGRQRGALPTRPTGPYHIASKIIAADMHQCPQKALSLTSHIHYEKPIVLMNGGGLQQIDYMYSSATDAGVRMVCVCVVIVIDEARRYYTQRPRTLMFVLQVVCICTSNPFRRELRMLRIASVASSVMSKTSSIKHFSSYTTITHRYQHGCQQTMMKTY